MIKICFVVLCLDVFWCIEESDGMGCEALKWWRCIYKYEEL